MKKWSSIFRVALAGGLAAASGSGFAYTSPSTGADGAFSPTASQAVQLPPSGVFNYTSVNIPTGVTITYIPNATNTPVTILATGDVTIAGTISVSATPPANPLDVTGSGLGGPGGYNGGRGGQPGGVVSGWVVGNYTGINIGGPGIGPGGGYPSAVFASVWGTAITTGGGGAYGSAPAVAGNYCPTQGGATYGNTTLIPMIGGSGGGGGAGGALMPGSGGGGGGGAILIASSGTLNVTGAILANGGLPSSVGTLDSRGSQGGAGSGGAIRLIATTVSGNGTINAVGPSWAAEMVSFSTYGSYISCGLYNNGSGNGGLGRIRIEAESLQRTAATNPGWVGGSPSLVFVPGMPTLIIDSVGGIAVPAQPTGSNDVALPPTFTNPVTVTFVTTGVTVGSSIKLTVIPTKGTSFSATSAPTTGTTASATSSVAAILPSGAVTLQATVTYTVVASVGDAMSVYAKGERVEKVTLASTLGDKKSKVTLTTVSGKEYVVPASALLRLQG